MPREAFDQELDRLEREVLLMAGLVEEAITESVETLRTRDMTGSRRVIAQDRAINEVGHTSTITSHTVTINSLDPIHRAHVPMVNRNYSSAP